jgi:hypothetical protein
MVEEEDFDIILHGIKIEGKIIELSLIESD